MLYEEDPLAIVNQQPQQEVAVKTGVKPTSPLQGMLNDLSSGRYAYGTAGDALRSGRLTQDEFNTFQQAYNQAAGTTPDTRTRSVGDLVVTTKMLEDARLGGNPFSVSDDLAQGIRDARQTTEETRGFEFGIGEDKFQDERQNQGFIETSLGTSVRAGGLGRLTELQDAQTANMLRAQGLEPVYEQTMYKGYRYNPNTGQYDYYDNTPSLIDQAIPVLIETGVKTVAGNALGAIAGAATGLDPSTVKNIKKTVDLVNDVKDGDVMSAVTKALDLNGMDSPVKTVQNFVESSLSVTSDLGAVGNAIGNWAFNNSDHIAEATVKFADKMLQGEGLEGSLKSAALEYIKDGGGFGDLIPDGAGFDIDTPEFIEQIGDMIVAGASALNSNVIKPTIKAADQIIRALPTDKEDWEALEDKVKEVAEPAVTTVRELGRDIEEAYDTVEDFVKEDVAPVVRETGRDIREAVDPVANVVRDTGRTIEEVYGEAEDFVKEDVAPVVRGVGRDIRGLVPDVDAPSFNFPDLDFSGLFSSLGGLYGAGASGGITPEQARLVNIQLTDPELVEGFDLSNPFLR
jgi:hypothetical protein